jgi:hypothetical protein
MMEGFGHARPAGTCRDNSSLLYCDPLNGPRPFISIAAEQIIVSCG